MALFGIGKKKKEAAAQGIPPPPKPPATAKIEMPKLELPKISARHVDDLERPSAPAEKEGRGPLFPEIPKLELPEIEAPETGKIFPPVGIPELPEHEMPETDGIPEHLPELENIKAVPEIPEEIPELEEKGAVLRKKSPLFINVDSYSEMIGQLNTTRAKLNEYASAATRVAEVRSKKDEVMEKWRNALEDIERKLLNIDYIMFEHES